MLIQRPYPAAARGAEKADFKRARGRPLSEQTNNYVSTVVQAISQDVRTDHNRRCRPTAASTYVKLI